MSHSRMRIEAIWTLAVCLGVFMIGGAAAAAEGDVPEHKQSLGAIAGKLNDPTSSIWALQVEFDLHMKKGRFTAGDYEAGGSMEIQPVMPFKITEKLGLITRPVIPIIFSAKNPVETSPGSGVYEFQNQGGLGDIEVPLMLNPKWDLGGFSFALGPNISFPSATDKAIGSGRWGLGPASLALWKNDKITIGALSEYYFDVGGKSSRDHSEHMTILYFAYYMFPGAVQVGMNPVISYNNKASSGNKWNVPIGLTVGKTIKWMGLPTKFQLGFDYSVKSEKNYGERFKLKLLITPVIPSPISKPWF